LCETSIYFKDDLSCNYCKQGRRLLTGKTVDFNHDYLTRQIIAYIGNKRKLLLLIHRALALIPGAISSGTVFVDFFSGSGIVSRLARMLGFEVHANDWEEYTRVINTAYLTINKSELSLLFTREGGVKAVLDRLNTLPEPCIEEQYMARYYAPAKIDIEQCDFRKERLFYTRSNALAIDKIRNAIEELYPLSEMREKNQKKRNLLLALLIYEAATHTNTSGVFKAYHKGFGGHNGDALKRILAPIHLKYPVLIDSPEKCFVYKEDANTLAKRKKPWRIDIAYIDPPYNQHQYGSNYHILNTIALWDKKPAPLEYNKNGVLKDKAAIRKDWVKTRSDYCYRDKAVSAFEDLIANVNSKYILISYSTEGIIPFEQMKKICSGKGEVSIITNEYTKYPGGKQSNLRINKNIEFVMIIDTSKKSSPLHIIQIDKMIKIRKLLLLFKKRFLRAELSKNFELIEDGYSIKVNLPSGTFKMKSPYFFEIETPPDIYNLDWKDIDILYQKLENCVCISKEEELEEIMANIDGDYKKSLYFVKFIPNTLKKLAHKKYRTSYYYWKNRILEVQNRCPDIFSVVKHRIENVFSVAEKRFNN